MLNAHFGPFSPLVLIFFWLIFAASAVNPGGRNGIFLMTL